MQFVQVFGKDELLDRIKEGGSTGSHLISINDPGDNDTPEVFTEQFQSILRLEFWDAETVEELSDKYVPKRIPQRQDAEAVIEFFNNTEEVASGYTLHCRRGISRSPAAALGLWYLILGEERAASDALIAQRRQAVPNRTFVAFFDEILGSRLQDFRNTVYASRMAAVRKNFLKDK